MAKKKNILQFSSGKNSCLDVKDMKEYLEAKRDEYDFKKSMADILEDQSAQFLSMIDLKGLTFEPDDAAAMEFLEAEPERFLDEDTAPALDFVAEDHGLKYQIHAMVLYDEDQQAASFQCILFKQDNGGLYQYDMDEGWIPAEDAGILSENLQRILAKPDSDPEKALLTCILEETGAVDDETFEGIRETYKGILKLYDQVKNCCKLAMVQDSSTMEDDGDDEASYVVGIVPRNPRWDGLAVVEDEGEYDLCQYISQEVFISLVLERNNGDTEVFEEDDQLPGAMLRRIASTKNIDEAASLLKRTFDRYYGEEELHFIPLSMEATMRAEEWVGPYSIEKKDAAPLNETEKREKEQFKWIADDLLHA